MGKTTKKHYERNCPSCDNIIAYKSYSGFYNANRNKSNCKDCYRKIAGESRSKTWAKRRNNKSKEYKRNCPDCNVVIEYTNHRSLWHANKNGSRCKDCANKSVSETLTGTRWPSGSRAAPTKKPHKEKWFRNCPECDGRLGYASKYSRDRADKNNSICNTCANFKYKKTFNDIITDDHIKKMRASKAGFDSWEEYLDKYPEKEFYKREVWSVTYKQDLESLTNFEKRGRCGVDGAYQIDHVISINEGWERGIPPEEIGHIDNLQMLPWEENREKGS